MKTISLTTLVILIGVPALAQDEFIRLHKPEEDRNRIRVGAMALFNAEVQFKSHPISLGSVNPGPASGGADHFYDDGYVRVDSTGNAFPPGATSFWGYNNPSQVVDSPLDPTVGPDSIAFHSVSGVSSGSSATDTIDPALGLELAYGRVLGSSPRWSWGLAGMLGYMNLDQQATTQNSSGAASVTDVYSLNVNGFLVTPPTAPYAGPYQAAPGSPLLNDTPVRTLGTASGMSVARHELDADILTLRLGPFVDYALLERLTLGLEAGLAVAMINSTFSYDQSITYDNGSGPVTVSQSGEDDDFSTLMGGFIGVRARYDFSPYIGVYVSASYMGFGDMEQSDGNQEVVVDFSTTFLVSGGLSLAF